MKLKSSIWIMSLSLGGALLSQEFVSPGLKIPTGGLANSSSSLSSAPDYTPDELAAPPLGEIQKIYLREVNAVRTKLGTQLPMAPAGAEGLDSAWYPKLVNLKMTLDQLASTRLQTDAFAMIPVINEAFQARGSDLPAFFEQQLDLLTLLSPVLVAAIGQHIADHQGEGNGAFVNDWVNALIIPGFAAESDWEDRIRPIEPAGLSVANPSAVVACLKAQPWQRAEVYLQGLNATDAFARYQPSGNGLASLKARYALDQTTIVAKWNELSSWVAQQKAASP